MPAIQSPALILVTGATGFVATWVVRSLLGAGFSVRGTARSGSKAQYLQNLFKEEYEAHRFETIIVEDMTQDGAFDEAVKGVEGIAHTASPCHTEADDPDELIIPAVRGTTSVLNSVLKFNNSCKRIIILSSASAIVNPNPTRPFAEKDWNVTSVKEVQEKGRNAFSMDKYRAGKTLAERAAWDFHDLHKDEIQWDVASFQPTFVFGPPIQECHSPSSLNTSIKSLFKIICTPNAGGKSDDELIAPGWSRLDVRDLAEAHTKVFLTEGAGGERFLISADAFTWQEVLDIAHSVAPEASHLIHKGKPGTWKDVVHQVRYDNTKSRTVLGLKYKPFEETIRDTIEEFVKRGWVQV